MEIEQATKKKIKGIPTTNIPNTKRSRLVGQMWRFFFKYNTEPKAALGIAAASFLLLRAFLEQQKDTADSPTRLFDRLWAGKAGNAQKKQSVRKRMV